MNNSDPQKSFNFARAIKKFFLSFLLIFSFAAYVLHKPSSNAVGSTTGKLGQVPPAPGSPANTLPPIASQPTATPSTQALQQGAAPSATPPASPTSTPAVASSGQYKDGIYTGPQVDAFYGLVQVQTTIQNGKIANVQFLQYPNDRRTSQRINSYAVPVLQQEAVQVQSANVDMITGATLTSQAFAMSLQAALQKAGR